MRRMEHGKTTTRRRITGALVLGLIGWPVSALQAQIPQKYELADLQALERAFVDLAEKVRPSVVAVRTYRTHNREARGAQAILLPDSQGSGFIIDSDGYVVTNRHVLIGADVISVILHDGVKYDAELIQADPRGDLAVLKIEAKNLRVAPLGDISGVRVNQWVFACGNPFGLGNSDGRTSVTYGVISALGRRMTSRLVGDSNIEYYGNMIETSATINPGNSGGALFNLDGEVIGVVTAIETTSGVSEGHGFAIPIDANARKILDMLKAGETVRYGFLGVKVQDAGARRSSLVAKVRTWHGAELDEIILEDGPAARAGLRAGDIVIEYDGHAVEDSDHLVRLVGFTPVGTTVDVVYLRDTVKRNTSVTVADRSEMLSRAE